MKIRELVQANKDGKTSTTKFWYNIACLSATCILLWYGYAYKLTWEMFGLYLISVGGFSSVSKFLNYRYKTTEEPSNNMIQQGE